MTAHVAGDDVVSDRVERVPVVLHERVSARRRDRMEQFATRVKKLEGYEGLGPLEALKPAQ